MSHSTGYELSFVLILSSFLLRCDLWVVMAFFVFQLANLRCLHLACGPDGWLRFFLVLLAYDRD